MWRLIFGLPSALILLICLSLGYPNFATKSQREIWGSNPGTELSNIGLRYTHGDFIFRNGSGLWSPLFARANPKFGFTHVGVIIYEQQHAYVLHAEANDLTLHGQINKTPLEVFTKEATTFAVRKNVMATAEKLRFITELQKMLDLSVEFDNHFALDDEGKKVYCTEYIWLAAKLAGVNTVVKTSKIAGKEFVLVDTIYSANFLGSKY